MAKFGDIPFNTEMDMQPGITVLNTTGSTLNIDLAALTGNTVEINVDRNFTLNFLNVLPAGKTICLTLKNDGLFPRICTFGTGIKAAVNAVTGLLSKKSVVTFRSDGTEMMQQHTALSLLKRKKAKE